MNLPIQIAISFEDFPVPCITKRQVTLETLVVRLGHLAFGTMTWHACQWIRHHSGFVNLLGQHQG